VQGAQLASVEQLGQLLNAPGSTLLVLPYGPAFPEEEWPEIRQFLQRCGNLGQPFTRADYRDHRKLEVARVQSALPPAIDD
jgi:hypothetical protein